MVSKTSWIDQLDEKEMEKMKKKYKVLSSVTNYKEYCAKGIQMLEAFGCEIVATENGRPYNPEELKGLITDFDAVIVGVDTWNKPIFSVAPELKALARFGIGVDNIDLESAKSFGIKVTNCRGLNSNSVAEHTVSLMLALIRKIPQLNQTTREGKWERALFREMSSCSVGLIGFGGIAQKVAEKLGPFGPRIYAYDNKPDTEIAKKLHVSICDLDTVLQCDIVSIHVPALPETEHLINKGTLSKMKDNALLINTARGVIVDEMAVYDHLINGKLSGYATDVFESDPVKPDNPLLTLDNFICTPHVAAESYENYELTGIATAEAIIDVLSGRTPKNLLV